MSGVLNGDGIKTAQVLRAFGRDGAILALTDYDRDIEFSGTRHKSIAGTSFGPLERTTDLAPDYCSIETGLSEDGLDQAAIATGVFAEARAELWLVDVENPEHKHLLSAGTIGELARNGDRVSIEFRSLAHNLSSIRGRIYQKSCDAALGDARCGIDLGAPGRSAMGAILSIAGLELTIELSQGTPSGDFALGTMIFEGGGLSGFSQPIRTAFVREGRLGVTLWEALPQEPAPGDIVRLTVGCDKRFATCKDRFQNAGRFRGFPHIPGVDVLTVQGRPT